MALFKSSKVQSYLLLSLAVWMQSCYYDNEATLYHISTVDCTKISARFATDIMPIVTANCATSSCHNTTAVGGVILQTYSEIYAKADRIRQRTLVDKTMPPNGSLTPSELNIIRCWLDSGAPNN